MESMHGYRIPNVSLQAIEVFCEVAKFRSFSRGAERLSISQSAASQQVAHLEEMLGVKLLDRSYRPLKVTDEGKLYLRECLQVLDLHRGALDRIRSNHSLVGGQVGVVSIYSVGLHTINDLVRKYMQEHNGSTVRLEYYHPLKVYEAVLNHEAEVGVISYPKGDRHIDVIPWIDEDMVLACSSNHPLSTEVEVGIESLADVNFVAFDQDLTIRKEIDRFFRESGIGVNILSQFDNIETIKQALDISSAVSILPRPSILREVERGLITEIRLTDFNLTRPVGFICRRGRDLSATAREFLDFLIDSAGTNSGHPDITGFPG
jgi:DNA-binding transcriptional LysR family regulator